MNRPSKIVVLLVLGIAALGLWWTRPGTGTGGDPEGVQPVVVPELGPAAMQGREVFSANCAACHGPRAEGTESGPPLVHRIYEPSHHADLAFLLAVRNGVRAHHWGFGDMPPVEGISEKEIEWIVRYVRELQRANGIE